MKPVRLTRAPDEPRARELWLQHAAGYLLFRDMRQFALDRIPKDASAAERTAAERAIDDTVYGLMMLLDGVSGDLSNDDHAIELQMLVRRVRADDRTALDELDLSHGDGLCMGFHGWRAGDFGATPPFEPIDESR